MLIKAFEHVSLSNTHTRTIYNATNGQGVCLNSRLNVQQFWAKLATQYHFVHARRIKTIVFMGEIIFCGFVVVGYVPRRRGSVGPPKHESCSPRTCVSAIIIIIYNNNNNNDNNNNITIFL